jgi:hypothetical protein
VLISHCRRDELVRLGLAGLLSKLEEASGTDQTLLRYIQRARAKLSGIAVPPVPAGGHA